MKYFVISDIHSFATEAKEVLRRAGFNKKNKDHTLIVCGDIFDRGDESLELYRYLKSIPKKRCILVKGNHESLYFELLKKQYPQYHDFSNGTVRTFTNIAEKVFTPYLLDHEWLNIRDYVKNHEITKWLQSDQWVDYFELDRYIFVHSFIPNRSDWRELSGRRAWEDARWGNPGQQYLAGYFDAEKSKGKTLVVGHWHTWYFHDLLGGQIDSTNRDIYYSDHLIALDGGVTSNGYELIAHPNVLVIDDSDFSVCYDQYGSKLTSMESSPSGR